MPATFYPSCKVRIQVRFEDFIPAPPVPSSGAPSPAGAEAFGPGLPEQLGQFQSVGIDIVPYSASVELNSYRLADTAKVTFSLRALPFDPRIIRAATLQVFGGTFSPKEYAEAMQRNEALLLPDAVPEGRGEAGASNELFRGFVDDWEMTLDAEGQDTVSISARDTTGPLLDEEIPEQFLQDLPDLPLDVLIQLLLTGDGVPDPVLSRRYGLPGFRGIVVLNESSTPVLPLLSQVRHPTYFDSKRTAKKGRRRPPANTQKQSYWDVITDLCVSAGLIVYIRPGTKPVILPGVGAVLPAAEIVISDPRTYYGDAAPTGIDLSTQRLLAYGINVKSLRVRRKIGGVKVPAVEVRSFDPVTGTRLSSRYPPLIRGKTNRARVGLGDKEEVKVFLLDEISGPGALTQLEAAARSIYDQLGRGEMEVEVRTKHLAALEQYMDDGIEADLFRLRPGDPVSIEIASALVDTGQVSAHTLFTSAGPDSRVASMIARGIPPAAATLAAAAMDNPFIQTTFRTQRIQWQWDNDAGWEATVEAINYLDVRDSTSSIDGLPIDDVPDSEIEILP